VIKWSYAKDMIPVNNNHKQRSARMVRVEQLMTRELACIESTQAVSAAANLVAFHLQPEFIQVEHIMSSPILSIDETESIFEAAGITKAAGTRHLAVGNEDQVLGMLSVRDLLSPVSRDEL
jgi:CBS domain-containing protein